jgi:5'-nucleotidase
MSMTEARGVALWEAPDTLVQILLTNDDGFYAPGLAALERAMRSLGDVSIVAPATEQSGVSHSITYLTPLIVNEVYEGDRLRGWACEGSPADCVKIGITEFLPRRPDLVVSGINSGLNAGINVLYSGTVAAAIEGAFFGIDSVAVSLEFDEQANFAKAAEIASRLIGQLLAHKGPEPHLYNVNIPIAALDNGAELRVVPMSVARYGEEFEKRTDPRGRSYFWATNLPRPPTDGEETDVTALGKGYMTLTALDYDMTKRGLLDEMRQWKLNLNGTIPTVPREE